MQVTARVIAGADDVIDPCLHRVRRPAFESDLAASLKPLAIALDHCVRAAGRAVVELIALRVILHDVGRGGTVERAAHARLPVPLCDFRMGTRAGVGGSVTRLRRARRGRWAGACGHAECEPSCGRETPVSRAPSLDFHQYPRFFRLALG